jgi:hypothetical protein
MGSRCRVTSRRSRRKKEEEEENLFTTDFDISRSCEARNITTGERECGGDPKNISPRVSSTKLYRRGEPGKDDEVNRKICKSAGMRVENTQLT